MPGGSVDNAEIERFRKLCDLLSDSQEPGMWQLLGYRIELVDVHQIIITRSTALRTKSVMSIASLGAAKCQLTPVVALREGVPHPEEVRVISIRGTRTTTPAPGHSLDALTGEGSACVVAVTLDRDEYLTTPVLEISTVVADDPPLGRFSLRVLLPVSKVEVALRQPLPLTEFKLKSPRYASVDLVGVSCRVIWQDFAQEVRDLVAARPAGELDEKDQEIVAWELERWARGTRDRVDALIKEITAEGDHVKIKYREWKNWDWMPQWIATFYGPNLWVRELRAAKRRISEFIDYPGPDASVRAQEAIDLFHGLDSTPFTYGTRLTSDGSVVLDALGAAVMDRGGTIAVDGFVIPFTTEAEPGTQGKRSALVLLLLALLLAGVARVDLSWLHGWLGRLLEALPGDAEKPLVTGKDAVAFVEPLVALLLIFPAALYAQFFQTRPRSDIGNRAQLSTFAALSTVFAFPLVPAVVAAIGGSFESVSRLCLSGAALALFAGVGVLFTFLPASLRRLRRNMVRRWRPEGRVASAASGGTTVTIPKAA